MHKSAMQQIQQIPRVGLGPGGMGAESKPHQCQQCLKSFSSNHQLVQHIRVHTGEKPYKCSYCDRRFKQLSHVQQHTRLHTGERPYKCHLPDCGRAFIQLSNLQQHLRNHDAQVERAKNRPFHCNICGKGFATESSLRTHTSKELQLHLGVLQQHAALIGGPNATSCPICHKLFLGGEALMEHMKHAHKDPNASGVAISPDFQFKNELINPSNSSPPPLQQQQQNQLPSHQTTTNAKTCSFSVKKTYPFAENLGSPCLQSTDPYLAKRRTANHPCPVCGKHYVNEGSLRKHLACHPETSQLTTSLRMWPCSVCQAVFTHENGLLTHMEHMRMDPKHQFAAQYVLSRAAAERRERDSILAATLAVSASGSGLLPMGGPGSGDGGGGGSNSMCPSPSAHSECSSNGRLSSAGSDPGSGLLHNNNNNCSNKLSDILRSSHSTHMHSQYGVDDLHANRMSLMAAAAAGIVSQSSGNGGVSGGMGSPVDTTSAGAAVQAAVVNLAAAMRMNQQVNSVSSVTGNVGVSGTGNGNVSATGQPGTGNGQVISSSPSALSNVDTAATAVAAMNAMRVSMAADSMMRSSMGVDPISHQSGHHHQHHHQHHQQNSPEAALRMQQAEAILRSQAEAAIRLAVSVAASSSNGSVNNDLAVNGRLNNSSGPPFGGSTTVPPNAPINTAGNNSLLSSSTNNSVGNQQSQQQHPPQSHTPGSEISQQQQQTQQSSHQQPQQQQQQQLQQNQQHQQQQQTQQQSQVSPDLSEAIRLQEHRLEQALRLHNDARAINFLSAAGSNGVTVAPSASVNQHQQQQQHQQHQQQQTQQQHNSNP